MTLLLKSLGHQLHTQTWRPRIYYLFRKLKNLNKTTLISIIPLMGTLLVPSTQVPLKEEYVLNQTLKMLNNSPELQYYVVDNAEIKRSFYHFEWYSELLLPLQKPPPNWNNKYIFKQKIFDLTPIKLHPKLNEILDQTLELCEWYRVDPIWILSILWVENKFRSLEESHMGAIGPMQIRPITGQHVNELIEKSEIQLTQEDPFSLPLTGIYPYENHNDFFSPFKKKERIHHKESNIEMGILYLKYLMSHYSINSKLATIAYNMGPVGMKKEIIYRQRTGQKNNTYLEKVLSTYQRFFDFIF